MSAGRNAVRFGLGLGVVISLASMAVAETVVVKPSNMEKLGWIVATQQGAKPAKKEIKTSPVAEATFEKVSKAPAGSGAFRMAVGFSASNPLAKVYLGTNMLQGVSLDKITQLKLWICPKFRGNVMGQPGQVEIAVTDSSQFRLLTFYPWGYPTYPYFGIGTWQEFDLLNTNGTWVCTNIPKEGNHGNWSWVLKRFPKASVIVPSKADWPKGTISGTGFNLKIGAGKARAKDAAKSAWWHESTGCNAFVDKLTIGYTGKDGKEVVTTYDFEPEQIAQGK